MQVCRIWLEMRPSSCSYGVQCDRIWFEAPAYGQYEAGIIMSSTQIGYLVAYLNIGTDRPGFAPWWHCDAIRSVKSVDFVLSYSTSDFVKTTSRLPGSAFWRLSDACIVGLLAPRSPGIRSRQTKTCTFVGRELFWQLLENQRCKRKLCSVCRRLPFKLCVFFEARAQSVLEIRGRWLYSPCLT
jgi:hypothetical protein